MTDPVHDPKVHTIYLGRQVYQASYEQMRDDAEIREAVDLVEQAVKANQLRYYVPPCQAARDFLNDSKSDVKMMVAPNGVGKTCLALIDVILDCIPNDPEWELFKIEGITPRVWMGPKKVAICTYKMQLHKRHIWPEIQKWIPHDQLGQYKPTQAGESIGRGHKEPSWDRDPHIRLNCGTRIYFMAYEQDQDVFESFACDLFLWDEQGVEAKFDGADERVRRRSGRHVFSLTPHKVDGRPDTGHGSWIHKMVTGQNTKGHVVGVYSMSIEDALERYYPAKKKAEAYTKWIDIPTKNNDIKTLREGRSRYYGEWHTTSGLVLDEVIPDIHFIDRFDLDNSYTLYRAVDHGTRNPTACLWFAVDKKGFIYCYREYYSVGKTISENVRNIVALSGNRLERVEYETEDDMGYEIPKFQEVSEGETYAKTVLDSRSFSTMDAQSGRPTGWVYRACGLLCQKASGKHDEFRIPLVKELLRINPELVNPITGEKGSPRMFFFSDLVNFQREWQGYVWEEYASGGDGKNQKEHGRQKDNHLITCFAGDTLVFTKHGNKPIKDIVVGDEVLTRDGYKLVQASAKTRDSAECVMVLLTSGEQIVCTPDHKFFVPHENKFLRIIDIDYLTQLLCRDSLDVWKQQHIKASHTDAIQNQNGEAIGYISKESTSTFIGLFGKITSGLFRRVITFITKTAIPQTMILAIWNVCRLLNTRTNTQNGLALNRKRTSESCENASLLGQKLMRPKGYIKKILKKPLSIIATIQRRWLNNARAAGQSLLTTHINKAEEFAQINATQSCAGIRASTTNQESALFADQNSLSTNTQKSRPVRVLAVLPYRTEAVYDIQVDVAHEFFANGVLVHNCLMYAAQIPMRYLGDYSSDDVLPSKKKKDKDNANRHKPTDNDALSTITGY